MAHWRLFYHLVWTTKNREPWLTPEIEPHVYRFLQAEAKKLYCPLFYVGGTVDHVHVLCAVRPALSPAEFVKQLKGSSSRFVSLEFKRAFAWQEGYGVFTVSEDAAPDVIDYVLHQKQHHAAGTSVNAWEQTEELNVGPKAPDAGV